MALRDLGGGSLQNLDLAINAQNLGHLLLELGIATFQIVAHLVRLDFLLAQDLAHRALNQPGETFVPRRRAVLACVTCQKPRRPQLMRIAVLLGLVARQRHQPGFGLRRDDWFFTRPWPILDRRQRPIAQRPLHAALNRLMMNPNSLPHRTERRILAIGQQHLRPRYPARRLGSRPRKSRQSSISSQVIANSTTRRHPAMMPLLVSPTAKQGIRHQPIGSMMQVSWNRSSSLAPGGDIVTQPEEEREELAAGVLSGRRNRSRVRLGSNPVLWVFPLHVRSSAASGNTSASRGCQTRADCVAKVP